MSDCRKYVDYIMEQAKNLLAIDSPSGYGREVTEYLLKELEALGVQARRTVKGGVIADFGGRNKEDGILLEAHCDTLGGMVAQIKENGRLKLTNIGGMKPANAEAENVRIITKADGIYEGTCQLVDASVHVNGSYEKTERTWDTVEVLVDERPVKVTPIEFKILLLLAQSPGRVFPAEEIYERVWNERAVNTDTVMVHIRNLREKIEVNPKEPKYLKVVWGVGYKIEKQA